MPTFVQGGNASATVNQFGAMTTIEFQLGGRHVRPLYEAPWDDYHGDPLLENLRGDFLCVPFGIAPQAMELFPSAWRELEPGPGGPAHGYSANNPWEKVSLQPDAATFRLDYPPEGPVESVSRRVTCVQNSVLFEDQIAMRRDTRLPLGLHPIFRLPTGVGAAKLNLPDCQMFSTLPVLTDESSILQPNSSFSKADSAPLRNGGTIDLTRLPFEQNTEELVLLCNVEEAKVSLDNLEVGYRVTLEWDSSILKHCLLWISNRGRAEQPWNSRNLCLGIEPVTSAFDLGEAISACGNPLSAQGFATSVALEVGKPHSLNHRISIESL